MTCNIVDFDGGFVDCQGVNDGMQIYFMFVTRKSQILTVPMENFENTVDTKIDTSYNISSFSTKNSIAFLGTEEGVVVKVDLNTKKVIEKYDSQTKLPLFHTKIVA